MARTSEAKPCPFNKRSFLRFPVTIDAARLVNEYNSIPADAWGVSHWDVHCSIDVLLLRGGTKGHADDFITDDIQNNPLLGRLPYIASLISNDGPFGGAVYAFIFRTKPNGITRLHCDDNAAWEQTLRIHFPIVTNDGAVLIAEGMSKHLSVGEAWSFDNQVRHGVVNGNETRVHMIIDVPPGPKINAMMEQAVFDPGERDPKRWAMIGGDVPPRERPMIFAAGVPLSIKEKKDLGLREDGFATRISRIGKKGRLVGVPLRTNDIVTRVNSVETNAVSRSALHHIELEHEPGETVTLQVLRDGRRLDVPVKLRPEDFFSPMARLNQWLGRSGKDTRKAAPSGY
jgi:hypothetical protein